MQVVETTLRGYTFPEMLALLRESDRHLEFLSTAHHSGFFAFDTAFITRLSPAERAEVDVVAASTAGVTGCRPLPIEHAFPKVLDAAVCSAVLHPVPGSDHNRFFLLTGGEHRAIVQARYFLTALSRHPDAVPRFRAGQLDWRAPITFVEGRRPVAAVMPVKV